MVLKFKVYLSGLVVQGVPVGYVVQGKVYLSGLVVQGVPVG